MQELTAWAGLVPSLGIPGVASAILHDDILHEAFSHLVDGFYEEFLNRAPDPGGEQAWVQFMVTGGTAEQVIAGFVAAPEFAQRNLFLITSNNSDAGYVQALYNLLLDRSLAQGSLTQSEIDQWLGALPSLGRAGVAEQFLVSMEFRGDAVRSFYGDPTLIPLPFLPFLPPLLHRANAPAASEIQSWVDSGLALLAVENGFDGSPEFFAGG